MEMQLLVAGGGIGGLAAAAAVGRAGWRVHLFEQAAEFAEAGAGLQLGPNATRRLQAWGVLDDPALRPFEPPSLSVRDAIDGRELGQLRLGARSRERYGAPYLTVHRADLHAALLAAAQRAGAELQRGARIEAMRESGGAVAAHLVGGAMLQAPAGVVADGVWSRLREAMLGEGPAPATGHVAYRALVPAASLPAALRPAGVQAWLGPHMHLVRYPVRGGEAVNVVGFIEGRAAMGWDHAAGAQALRDCARGLCAELQAIVEAADVWRLWPVHDRPPVRSPADMARGRIALLGDAAHPMRPYLAQGAGMAIEDAAVLAQVLAGCAEAGVPRAMAGYAAQRWARAARVQARSRRNGRIFHASGPLRWARNAAMRAGGEALLDLPWLYEG